MKKIITLFVVIFCLGIFLQSSNAQEKGRDGFEKMTFEVKFDKKNYFPVEPVFAKFKFSNQTQKLIETYAPNFVSESKVKFKIDGKMREISWFNSIIGGGIRFPNTFKPNEFYEREELLGPTFGWNFTEPGNFQLQFILRSSDGSKTIESNVIDITIENPTGINKEAFDFMKKHKDFFGLSSWAYAGEERENLLETFVNNYSQSVYGELAISSLGTVYLVSKGQLERSRIEFEKIKDSSNNVIAEDAKRSLLEIEKRKLF